MPEIEDVRALAKRVKDAGDRAFQSFAAGDQGEWVEIALDREAPGQFLVGPDRVDGLVEADRIDPGFARIGAKLAAGTLGKADHRDAAVARLSFSTNREVGAITQRSNSAGARLPAQLSNSCTASAPAAIWPLR